MATGPLALLGDAIASGTGDWAALERARVERERARGERVADVAAERQFVTGRDTAQQNFQAQQATAARDFEKSQLSAAQEREERLYKARFLDSVKLDLIRQGFLAPGDVGSPDAIAQAMKKAGPEYERTIQELNAYRSAILRGEIRVPGVESVLEMGPDRIAEVREIMASAAGTIADVTEAERKNIERGQGNVAGMVARASADLAALSGERSTLNAALARLNGGQFTPQEAEEIRQLTMAEAAKSGITDKNFNDRKNAEAVAAARQRAIQQFVMTKGFGLQQALLENNRRYSEANEALGIASRISPAIAGRAPTAPAALSTGGAPAAAPAQPAVAGASDAAAFLGLKKPAASAPGAGNNASPVGATRAPAVIQLPPTFGNDAISSAVYDAGGKIGGAIKAGVQFLTDGAGFTGLNSLDSGIRAESEARALRQEEDRVLASDPYSERANQIRQKRGMPPLIDTRTPALLAPR